MDECKESVSLVSVISGMLLFNKKITAADIVNVLSVFSWNGIYVDDEICDISCLSSVVLFDDTYSSFELKEDLDYESIVERNLSVYDFLRQLSSSFVISFLNDNVYSFVKSKKRD